MASGPLPRCGVLVLSFVLISGCRSAQRTTSASTASFAGPIEVRHPRNTRDVLLRHEFISTQLDNAYDIVMRLRPEFLKPREDVSTTTSSRTIDPPVVYLDGVRQGELSMLRGIPTNAIDQIRYYRPTDALSEFGPKTTGGVISVRTLR